jgi:predicted LPLAT superfamily acyltransferase
MNFNPCLLIPIFNNHETIEKTIHSVQDYHLPCIIVDDGSDGQTKGILKGLQEKFSWITLLHLPENQGKGAALVQGFRKAFAQGFSHALQIDADGQHEAKDIARFLEMGKENPQALILGEPRFDDCVPKIRLWGRKLTNLWVWVNTLSFQIRDAMCGFRLYPLFPTVRIINANSMAKRMAFDIEICVRLFWQNVPVIPVSTLILYPPGGKSHFRFFYDNVFISLTHAKLCMGMMLRFPWLLFRKETNSMKNQQDRKQWFSHSERGSILGLRFTFWVYKALGRGICTIILYPVLTYFFLTAKKNREASLLYLNRLYCINLDKGNPWPYSLPPNLWLSYRHFLEFGFAALDRVAVWAGKIERSQLVWKNRHELEALIEQKQGAIFMSAHLGNIEIMRSLSLKDSKLKINALMFTKNAERFNKILDKINAHSHLRVISLDAITTATMQTLQNCIQNGEFIVLLADRISVGSPEKIASIPFLGERAPFPEGPFLLASLLKCPVYTLFCLRQAKKQYRIFFELLSKDLHAPRKIRKQILREGLNRYVQKLESLCSQYPLQWYNFFDFWHLEEVGQIDQMDEILEDEGLRAIF